MRREKILLHENLKSRGFSRKQQGRKPEMNKYCKVLDMPFLTKGHHVMGMGEYGQHLEAYLGWPKMKASMQKRDLNLATPRNQIPLTTSDLERAPGRTRVLPPP